MSPAGVPLPTPLLGNIPDLKQLQANAPLSWYLLPTGAAAVALLLLFLLWKTRTRRHAYAWVPPEGIDPFSPAAAALRARRSRRRSLGFFLGLVLALCVAWIALLVWSAGQGKAFNPHKPFWWLMAASDRVMDPREDDSGVIEELYNRLKAIELSDGQIGEIVERAVTVHQDPRREDAWYWCSLVEQARATRSVPDDHWMRYLRQILTIPPVRLVVRDQVRRGDPLPAQIRLSDSPRAYRASLAFTYDLDQTLTVAGQTVGQPTPQTAGSPGTGREEKPTWAVDLSPGLLSQLKDGPQCAQTKVTVTVWDQPLVKTAPYTPYTVTYTLTAPWNLLPATAQTVTAVPPAAVPLAVPPDFSKQVRVQVRWWGAVPEEYHVGLERFPYGPPYTDLAFRLFLRTRRGEWEVGSGATTRDNLYVSWVKPLPGLRPDSWLTRQGGREQVNVILRPSEEAALRSVDCYQYWDGEIVVPDVWVNW